MINVCLTITQAENQIFNNMILFVWFVLWGRGRGIEVLIFLVFFFSLFRFCFLIYCDKNVVQNCNIHTVIIQNCVRYQINGCYKVAAKALTIGREGNLQINASVTEAGTGMQVQLIFHTLEANVILLQPLIQGKWIFINMNNKFIAFLLKRKRFYIVFCIVKVG